MSRPFYDEMRDGEGAVRARYRGFADWLERTGADRIGQKRDEAERAFHLRGLRLWRARGDRASDSVRHRAAHHSGCRTAHVRARLKQRAHALDLLLHDIYHQQKLLQTNVVPAERVHGNAQYRPEMHDVRAFLVPPTEAPVAIR